MFGLIWKRYDWREDNKIEEWKQWKKSILNVNYNYICSQRRFYLPVAVVAAVAAAAAVAVVGVAVVAVVAVVVVVAVCHSYVSVYLNE